MSRVEFPTFELAVMVPALGGDEIACGAAAAEDANAAKTATTLYNMMKSGYCRFVQLRRGGRRIIEPDILDICIYINVQNAQRPLNIHDTTLVEVTEYSWMRRHISGTIHPRAYRDSSFAHAPRLAFKLCRLYF